MIPIRSLARLAVMAILGSLPAGCGPRDEPRADPVAAAVPVPVPVADPIPGFVDYLRRNGVVLAEDHRSSNEWKVVEPRLDGPCDVVVYLRGFPPGRTVPDMERDLLGISIFHRLNAPARLAMSDPSLRCRSDPAPGSIPDVATLPVTALLQDLFRSYRGPATPGR